MAESINSSDTFIFNGIEDVEPFEAYLLGQNDLSSLSPEQQTSLIVEKLADHERAVLPSTLKLTERFEQAVAENRKLKVKYGIDPTMPDIHLGHAVSMVILKQIVQMGHTVEILIGDFTAKIGDPSGRMNDRPLLGQEEVDRNSQQFLEQLNRFVDTTSENVRVVYNSSWYDKEKMDMAEWFKEIKNISVNQLLERRDFRMRLEAGERLSLAELTYSVVMGYDSVVLNPDIEFGGIDQMLNIETARDMMARHEQVPELGLLVDLLPGTSGERDSEGRLAKMSKSKGNYVSLNEEPNEMFAKTMSISDEAMWIWLNALTIARKHHITDLKKAVETDVIAPFEVKKMLGRVIVSTFHGSRETATKAQNVFESKFGANNQAGDVIPDDVEMIAAQKDELLIDVLSRCFNLSKSRIRKNAAGVKLHQSGSFSGIDSSLLADSIDKVSEQLSLEDIITVKFGRKFVQIEPKKEADHA